jgi:hypothetical protein
MTMAITLPLEAMTTEEKIQTMESIWVDLCKESANIPSPAWHGNILNERVKREEEFIDWESAKGKIKNDLS